MTVVVDSREIMMPVDIATVRRTGYDIANVQTYIACIEPHMDGENPKKRHALYVKFANSDAPCPLEGVATHMQYVLRAAFPYLQSETEPIRPVRPSQGLTVAAHTDDECVFDLHLKPAKGGLTIVPFMGDGAASGFLEFYGRVLGREVARQ